LVRGLGEVKKGKNEVRKKQKYSMINTDERKLKKKKRKKMAGKISHINKRIKPRNLRERMVEMVSGREKGGMWVNSLPFWEVGWVEIAKKKKQRFGGGGRDSWYLNFFGFFGQEEGFLGKRR